jgi:hypothetical protein
MDFAMQKSNLLIFAIEFVVGHYRQRFAIATFQVVHAPHLDTIALSSNRSRVYIYIYRSGLRVNSVQVRPIVLGGVRVGAKQGQKHYERDFANADLCHRISPDLHVQVPERNDESPRFRRSLFLMMAALAQPRGH